MATNCEDKLAADIAKDCDQKPVGGIEINAVFINFEDIDKTASTLDVSNELIITNLATNSATSGFNVEGIKQTQGVACELVLNEEGYDKYKHSFAGVVLTPTAANKAALASIASGGRYVVVIEKLFKGALGVDAFEVLGWDRGLVISVVTYNSKEADGIWKFEVSSPDGYEEPNMTRNVLETDYATTKVAFDAKFATV